jgi:hypothetical protein
MPAQMLLEARLQLQESLESRIRLSSRHAPTWRPLDHRFRPRHNRRLRRTGPLAAVDKSPALMSTQRHFSARVQPLIETPQKGRKEGTWRSTHGRKPARLKGRRDGGGFMSLAVFKAHKLHFPSQNRRPGPHPASH